MNILNTKVIFLAIVIIFAAASVQAESLDTPSFKITIKGCNEGDVSCDNVKYVGFSKKNGESITLTGKTVNTMSADGVTPDRFIGYEFKNGQTLYFVGEDGTLKVTQGSKVLVSEQGKWDWQ
jgi:hypothetical protein